MRAFSGRAIGAPVTDTADVILEQLEVTGIVHAGDGSGEQAALGSAGERHTAFTGRMLALVAQASQGPF